MLHQLYGIGTWERQPFWKYRILGVKRFLRGQVYPKLPSQMSNQTNTADLTGLFYTKHKDQYVSKVFLRNFGTHLQWHEFFTAQVRPANV